MPETHELPLGVIRKAWDEHVKAGAEGDSTGSPWAGVDYEGNEERAVKFARAIVTAARESDAAARIAAKREGWDAAQAFICGPAIAGAVLDAERDRLYPLPTRECVLSDGATVHFNDEDNVLVRTGARRVTIRRIRVCWPELLHEEHTGADWDALKSFAAGVGR